MASRRGLQLLAYDPARRAGEQLRRPCSDCPWARGALAGWLGSGDVDDWLVVAHSDAKVECHVYSDVQCAGLAIYRANVAKAPRDPEVLRLPADRAACFAAPHEFMTHHANTKRPAPSNPQDGAGEQERTCAMKKEHQLTVYEHYVVVQGSGDFPLDMLRYDNAVPMEQCDSGRMAEHGVRRVALTRRGVNDTGTSSAARWQSFGWVVLRTYPGRDMGPARELRDAFDRAPGEAGRGG